ncbi:hypothetical protein V7S43_009902 [Phytophthora oleae]|uniref:Protein kinase domain-containing protein n=1 Tax=Phytophthora oleae TaxID=2107226 RepID=A0ABD3FI96_9STRA
MSSWVTRLTNACSSLGVDVVEGDTFLGRGAFGRVFKVTRNGEVLALKIVEQDSVGRLYDEEQALTNAQDSSLTVTPVEEVFKMAVDKPVGDYDSYVGAALLLCPVGDPLPRPTTLEEVQQLFKLLWQLHTKGWVHGDPRVPNVIVSEGKLLWIDLMEPKEASTELKETD